jgi:hypothetical protein
MTTSDAPKGEACLNLDLKGLGHVFEPRVVSIAQRRCETWVADSDAGHRGSGLESSRGRSPSPRIDVVGVVAAFGPHQNLVSGPDHVHVGAEPGRLDRSPLSDS